MNKLIHHCILRVKEIDLINEGHFDNFKMEWTFDKSTGKLKVRCIRKENEMHERMTMKINNAYRDYNDWM